MSEPLRKPANDVDAIDDCWIPLGAAADAVFAKIEAAINEQQLALTDLVDGDFLAMEAVEGGPVQTVDVPGAGGDA